MKSTPTRGVKQFLKPNAYKQSELDWTLMTICAMQPPNMCWRMPWQTEHSQCSCCWQVLPT